LFIKLNLADVCLFLLWLLLATQSVFDLGYFFVFVWLLLVVILIKINMLYCFVLIAISYYLPVPQSFLPSPFLILHIITFSFFIARFDVFKLAKAKYSSYLILYFILSIFYSVLIFNIPLDNNQIYNYLLTILFSFFYLYIFTVINNYEKIDFILKRIVIFSSLAVILSLVHFTLGDSTHLYSSYLSQGGGSEDLFSKLYTASDKSVVRIMWPGVDPNYYASMFIFPFAVSVYYLQKEKLFVLPTILIGASILGTFSRTAFLILLLVIVILFWRSKYKFKALMVVLLSILIVYFNFNDYVERITSISNNIVEHGGSGRFDRISEGLKIWAANVFGIGIGNIYTYGMGNSCLSSSCSTHNTFLQVLVDSGIVLFILFVFALFKPLTLKLIDNTNSNFVYHMRVGLFFTLLFYLTIPVSDFRFYVFYAFIFITSIRLSEN
jgi:O-antigen ligase